MQVASKVEEKLWRNISFAGIDDGVIGKRRWEFDSGQSLGSNTRQVTAVEPVMVTAILKLTELRASISELRALMN